MLRVEKSGRSVVSPDIATDSSRTGLQPLALVSATGLAYLFRKRRHTVSCLAIRGLDSYDALMKPKRPQDGQCRNRTKSRERTLEIVKRIQKCMERAVLDPTHLLDRPTLATGAILPLAVDKGNSIGSGLMTTATLLLSSALAYEIYTWLKSRLDSRLLTMLTGAITAVGGVFALGFAGDALNAATAQDPAIFGYARTLLSLLMTLRSAAFVVVLFSLPVMLIVAAKSAV